MTETREMVITDVRRWARVVGLNAGYLRALRGWTLREMATRVSEAGHPIDQQRMSAVERQAMGTRNRSRPGVSLHVDLVVALARALGVGVLDLLDETGRGGQGGR